jgi:hypothetical protein
MQQVLRIIRVSSKLWFKLLKEKSPYKCTELNDNIKITNIFLKHISWYQKQRTTKEIVIRLWMINIISEILKEWKIIEEREDILFEWKSFLKSYRIQLKIKWIFFIVIIWKKDDETLVLLSCFSKILD